MKYAIVLSAFLAIASAYPKDEPASCKFCNAGTMELFKALSSMEATEIEGKILISKVCEGLEGCVKGVEAWWAKVAKVIFSDEGAKYTCKAISKGACNAFQTYDDSKWNCDACKADLDMVAEALSSDAAIKDIVGVLQGKAFCMDSGLGLNPDQQKTCGRYIDAFLPAALKALMEVLKTADGRLCSDIYNICME